MARRKNIKRIDPRYFLNETVNRGEDLQEFEEPGPCRPGQTWKSSGESPGEGGCVDLNETEDREEQLEEARSRRELHARAYVRRKMKELGDLDKVLELAPGDPSVGKHFLPFVQAAVEKEKQKGAASPTGTAAADEFQQKFAAVDARRAQKQADQDEKKARFQQKLHGRQEEGLEEGCPSEEEGEELEEGFGTALRGIAGAGKAAVQKMAGHGGSADMVQTEKQIQRLVADHLSASDSPRLTLQMLQKVMAPLAARAKKKEEDF